jgi:hypothetical protein
MNAGFADAKDDHQQEFVPAKEDHEKIREDIKAANTCIDDSTKEVTQR